MAIKASPLPPDHAVRAAGPDYPACFHGLRCPVGLIQIDTTWNDNPRPFTWTKTADEILNSLASYLAKLGTRRSVSEQD